MNIKLSYRKTIRYFCLGLILSVLTGTLSAQSPVKTGHPDRSPGLDAWAGFVSPPAGFGEVPFYWWPGGDTLLREQMSWQLDQLQGKHISSIQVNYAHSDKGRGGRLLGYPIETKPKVLTDEWWTLFGWFMQEASKRNMTVSLSDYTFGVGQQAFIDNALAEHPDLLGHELFFEQKTFTGTLRWSFEQAPLYVGVYKTGENGEILPGTKKDLTASVKNNSVEWRAPAGEWTAVRVWEQQKEYSYDPMHPLSGSAYVKHFFQQFIDRFEGAESKLNFFFSDELDFRLKDLIWNGIFREEFRKRKGYDIVPHLPALFIDEGDITPKIRLDYNDVMVSLSEEHFFIPVYNWHEEHGLIYGCDHGGRGKKVAEFGDYFRTQRWNQGPGCDQPSLQKDITKNKVAASIAHMYERPRVWLEGFWGSGWGTSSGMLTDAILGNFVMGQNILSLHGLYYSTPGGWWEWAPPCNHFRMPYWAEMETLLAGTERLSYLFSQGYHRADVAMLYPVEPVVAGYGNDSPLKAFALGETLYKNGIDFDYIDYESLDRAEIRDGELHISGESFKVLIIPSMKAIRHSSLEKALAFKRQGGIVINYGDLPEATENKGRNNRAVKELVEQLFSKPAGNGQGVRLIEEEEVLHFLRQSFVPDFRVESPAGAVPTPYIMHRRIGPKEMYAVYNVEKGTECFFRATGSIEIWDPWTAERKPLKASRVTADGTYIRMPLTESEIQIVLFDPEGKPTLESQDKARLTRTISVEGNWSFNLLPTYDNRWGDYHWPPTNEMIGAEISEMRYLQTAQKNAEKSGTEVNDLLWDTERSGFGKRFLLLQGIKNPLTDAELFEEVQRLDQWEPYRFSWRWGVLNDWGHQGFHGLKKEISDNFIRLGVIRDNKRELVREENPAGNNYYLYTHVFAPHAGEFTIEYGTVQPATLYLNGTKQEKGIAKLRLNAGANELILHYNVNCTTYLVFRDPAKAGQYVPGIEAEKPLASIWNGDLSILPYEVSGNSSNSGWFRFLSAPGLEKLEFSAYGEEVRVWADGISMHVTVKGSREDGLRSYEATVANPSKTSVPVAIEIPGLQKGFSSGAAIPYPVKERCREGEMAPGDWSVIDGLRAYSGGAIYRKAIELTEEQLQGEIELDLGEVVSTARLTVNGKDAGVRFTPPWTFDVTRLVQPGGNRIEVTVYNTAANHYTTIPTKYRGDIRSGLIGPVRIRITE